MSITVSELTLIQSDANALLDKTCLIRRATLTADAYGTQSETWADVTTVDAGMAQPSAGLLANYAFLIGSLATWKVRLPYGTDVREKDQLVIDGQTLIVQVILSPQSYSVFANVLASEVK